MNRGAARMDSAGNLTALNALADVASSTALVPPLSVAAHNATPLSSQSSPESQGAVNSREAVPSNYGEKRKYREIDEGVTTSIAAPEASGCPLDEEEDDGSTTGIAGRNSGEVDDTVMNARVGKNPKKKTKRRQLVSCDACRLRRVKCEKEPGADQCKQCIAKSVTCTDEYVRNKPRTLKRTGKLIEKAKALYGDVYRPASLLNPHPAIPLDLVSPYGPPEVEYPNPSRSSASGTSMTEPQTTPSPPGLTEQSLISSMLTQTLSGHLVDCYYAFTHLLLPAVDWTKFESAYVAAGRRSQALDPANEFLCHCIEAYGARISDSPYILGPSAPRLTDLKAPSYRAVNLAPWGKRREAFCDAMLQRAMKTCDRNGCMRIPVDANMTGLVLLDHLMMFRDAHRRSGRIFTAALVELMRVVSDDNKAGLPVDKATLASAEGGRIFWHAYITDACKATIWRKPPQITHYDVEQLCPSSRSKSFQSIWAALHTTDPACLIAAAIDGLFGHITLSAHSFVEWLCSTNTSAATAADGPQAIRDLYQAIDRSEELSELFARRLQELIPAGASNFVVWQHNLTIIRALLTLNAEVYVKSGLRAAEAAGTKQGSGWAGLVGEAAKRTFEGSKAVANIVRKRQNAGHLHGGHWPYFMQAYGNALLETPLTSQGGPENWGLETKLETVGWIIDGLKAAGWVWSGFETDIAELEGGMNIVRQQADIDDTRGMMPGELMLVDARQQYYRPHPAPRHDQQTIHSDMHQAPPNVRLDDWAINCQGPPTPLSHFQSQDASPAPPMHVHPQVALPVHPVPDPVPGPYVVGASQAFDLQSHIDLHLNCDREARDRQPPPHEPFLHPAYSDSVPQSSSQLQSSLHVVPDAQNLPPCSPPDSRPPHGNGAYASDSLPPFRLAESYGPHPRWYSATGFGGAEHQEGAVHGTVVNGDPYTLQPVHQSFLDLPIPFSNTANL